MARPNQESIDTFMSITGASESVAVRKLEEHLGDLNEAVNAYFSEGDRNMVPEAPMNVPQDDAMDIDDVIPSTRREPPVSLLSAARTMDPFSLLQPNLGRSLFDNDPLMSRSPFVTHPREVRQIPIEVKDSSEPSGRSSDAPAIEDVTGTVHAQGPAVEGMVIIDEESDDNSHAAPRGQSRHVRPTAPAPDNFQEYNDIEEEMIRAAIEASKKEAEGPRNPSPGNRQSHNEDDDIAKAVTMSLKSAEEEVLRNQGLKASSSEGGTSKVTLPELQNTQAVNGRSASPSSPLKDDSDDVEEQPLVRHRSRRGASGSQAPPNFDRSRSPGAEHASTHPPDSGNGFASEWGGISSEEHDEAVMLEAAMFGGIPESGYSFPYASRQHMMTPRPPSPSLTAQRMIREQQDDEYNASLQADREKEMKAIREAEARQLEEEAAKMAALEEEKRKEEEARRKLEEEQELERQLVAKEASLPREPPADEENAMTLLVRMPDGTRLGRRFLKSDKLQSLFDFIDIGRVVKPGTYRLVRPYPRRPFSEGESESTLNDLGLTSKQEALFLELI
ncbi:PREDICTED: plant UBX domain-containing protein 8 isoform X2 [Tarenaya hassleriana]|uniref:plant UBX domain-containing protein 8 isoform X2 n=1 Tax=Tarenaya hassleriana TaxID=28532 RepID=UPI00053C0D25|nr:PREDICTED: plant UBX domain-containing protein 8 isoform X2 [Tarenaya hassleriana]